MDETFNTEKSVFSEPAFALDREWTYNDKLKQAVENYIINVFENINSSDSELQLVTELLKAITLKG